MQYYFSIKVILILFLCIFVIFNIVVFTIYYIKSYSSPEKNNTQSYDHSIALLKRQVDFNHTHYNYQKGIGFYNSANKKYEPMKNAN